jgi:hypothetical protein
VRDEPSGGAERWHLDRRVSIGHLLTTAVVGISAILWLSDVDSRVSLNAHIVDAASRRIDRIEARQATALTELKDEIRDGFAAVRTDFRTLAARVDRQRDLTPDLHP